jgi:RHS repeat-associated protein
MIYYIYDASGNVIGLKYNNDIYYYEKNIQNDITGIMDDSFNLLATYEYDSWGNILSIKDTNGNTITDSSNIALVNPFRYRSYYYDSEIGMYYLNSRYYNSEWGRFINADGTIGANGKLLGNNLYAYVNNNPIMFSDPSGNVLVPSLSKYMTRQQKQRYFIKTNPIPPKSVATSIISENAAREYIDSKLINRFYIKDLPLTRKIYLVKYERRTLSPAAKAFERFVLSYPNK